MGEQEKSQRLRRITQTLNKYAAPATQKVLRECNCNTNEMASALQELELYRKVRKQNEQDLEWSKVVHGATEQNANEGTSGWADQQMLRRDDIKPWPYRDPDKQRK